MRIFLIAALFVIVPSVDRANAADGRAHVFRRTEPRPPSSNEEKPRCCRDLPIRASTKKTGVCGPGFLLVV
jgi:hypothetical protein